MKRHIAIKKLIRDNLMSMDQIKSYILDDFRVNPHDIEKIIAFDSTSQINIIKLDIAKIPHHRYDIFLSKNTKSLYIKPIEGKLRIKHIELETQILSSLYNKKISFINYTNNNYSSLIWLEKILKSIKNKKISGIIVGSILNFNFFLKLYYFPNFVEKTLKVIPKTKINDYIDYQLKLIILEKKYIEKSLILNEEEINIFKEGKIPDNKSKKIATSILSKIGDITTELEYLKTQKDLIQYIALDYLYFYDLEFKTSYFDQTLIFPQSQIIQDDFLSYQLLTIGNYTYINFSWANPEVINEAINILKTRFIIDRFYMYGKCGSLHNKFNIGDLIIPISSTYDNNLISINNQFSYLSKLNIKKAHFACVDSPLIETKSWFTHTHKKNINCVEMELYNILNTIQDIASNKIIYYISDKLIDGPSLAVRFNLLEPRLQCCRIIMKDILDTQ